MKNQFFFTYLMFAIVVLLSVQACKKDRFVDKKTAGINNPINTNSVNAYYVTTFAGSDDAGYVNGTSQNARFGGPRGITALGDYLYVSDQGNQAIRKIKISDSTVTTLAGGNGTGFLNGPGNIAKFNNPIDIAAGPDKNLYVTDFFNYKIRKITCSGVVSTYAGCDSGYVDGPVSKARFGRLMAIGIGKTALYMFTIIRLLKSEKLLLQE